MGRLLNRNAITRRCSLLLTSQPNRLAASRTRFSMSGFTRAEHLRTLDTVGILTLAARAICRWVTFFAMADSAGLTAYLFSEEFD